MNIEVLAILLLVAINCIIIGVYLYERKLSMMSDAISHTILFGIAIGFFISNSIKSPILIICAILVGLLSSWFIGVLKNTGKVNEDAATGIVFTFFFSLAIIIITYFARNVHLDLDSVLLGEVVFSPLNRMTIFNLSLPVSFVWLVFNLIINSAFIIIFRKELKITSFDPTFALVSGISSVVIHYLLMSVVSLTSVLAFDAVGSVLVISLMIGPVISARLLAHTLKDVYLLSLLYGVVTIVVGYWLAVVLNVSIAGTIASVITLAFILTVAFAPQTGIITTIIKKRNQSLVIKGDSILMHLKSHEGSDNYAIEAGVDTLPKHFNWEIKKTQRIINNLLAQHKIEIKDNAYYLTDIGNQRLLDIVKIYQIPLQLTSQK